MWDIYAPGARNLAGMGVSALEQFRVCGLLTGRYKRSLLSSI